MSLPYSKKVLDYFQHPRNVGEIENPDAVATEGSPACGDMVKLFLKVNPDSHVIEDVKFKSYGCASNIATASIITELAKGKTIEEAKGLSWKDAENELEGLPPVKVHCAVLAVDALHTAIENYEHGHGLLTEKVPTGVETVKKRLGHVISPVSGCPISKDKIVQEIEVSGGIVTVRLSITRNHQFAGAIAEDIEERIIPLWDVEEVNVTFEEE